MTTEPSLPVAPSESLGGILGIEHLEFAEDRATGRFDVGPRHMQPMGIVHGGALAALAEGLVSEATAHVVGPQGFLAQGMNLNVNFLRPIMAGTVHAEGVRRHRGRTTWVWDVDLTDDDGRLCAAARVTVAVRPMPDELKVRFGLA